MGKQENKKMLTTTQNEYKSANEDCQAAAGLYGEVGQMKQAQALEADLVKLAAFLPNE